MTHHLHCILHSLWTFRLLLLGPPVLATMISVTQWCRSVRQGDDLEPGWYLHSPWRCASSGRGFASVKPWVQTPVLPVIITQSQRAGVLDLPHFCSKGNLSYVLKKQLDFVIFLRDMGMWESSSYVSHEFFVFLQLSPPWSCSWAACYLPLCEIAVPMQDRIK
jgi:hypothetical protein